MLLLSLQALFHVVTISDINIATLATGIMITQLAFLIRGDQVSPRLLSNITTLGGSRAWCDYLWQDARILLLLNAS